MAPNTKLLRSAALANGEKFHLIACARVGKTWFWRTNAGWGQCAERRLLSSLRGLQVDEVTVIRFKPSGGMGLAKPCAKCQKALQAASVRWVKYSNDDGTMTRERV